MDRIFTPRYLSTHFEPSDRLAVVLSKEQTGSVIRRFALAEHVASREFQAWLRKKNEDGYDVRFSMNALKPDALSHRKDDVETIRHIWLEFDHKSGPAADRLIESLELPKPNCVLKPYWDTQHLVWRVDSMTKDGAEQLQRSLAQQWGADTAATDCARMRQLPGFFNYQGHSFYVIRGEPKDSVNPTVYRRDDFPDFPNDRPGSEISEIGQRSASSRQPSQAELDQEYARQALARGESHASIIKALAEHRRNDHSDPEDYAAHTVRKAATQEAKEQDRGYEIV